MLSMHTALIQNDGKGGKNVMMNYIWVGLVVIAVIFGAITGSLADVQGAIFDFAMSAVEIVFELIGILCFFSGLMAVAEKAGLTEKLGQLLKPVMTRLFPGIPADHPAMSGIVMNMAANIMGLGNAATPFGLKAMSDMQRLNPHKEIATDDMVMFLAINTSSVTLIPTTVIGLRAAAGSANAAEVVGPIILATIISTATAIICATIFKKVSFWKLDNFVAKEKAAGIYLPNESYVPWEEEKALAAAGKNEVKGW